MLQIGLGDVGETWAAIARAVLATRQQPQTGAADTIPRPGIVHAGVDRGDAGVPQEVAVADAR